MRILKNKTYMITMVILFTLLLFIFNMFSQPHKKQLQAKKGTLDLVNWDFQKDGVASLDGEWEFYWNQLLTYEDFHKEKQIEPDGYVAIPDVWTNYTLNGNKFPGEGYATYRLKIKTSSKDSLKGVKILTASTSYRLMINDEIVAENGVVGKTRETSVPQYRPQTVSFKNASKDFEIIIQVSNYVYSRGGMWHSIYLGNDQQIRTLKEFNSGKKMFILGVSLIMALYHITLFLLQKRNKSALYFALILLVTAIRITITGEYLILNIIPSASITWMVPVEYMTMYWGLIIGIAFIHELYPEEMSRKVMKNTMYIGIIISLFTIAVPISVFTKYLIFYEIIIIYMYGYIAFSVLRAVFKKRDGAILMFLGAVIVFIVFISDVLYYWNMICNKCGPIIEIGVFMFIFIQSYILLRRFSRAFDKVEELSEKLISLNKLKDEFLVTTSHELQTPLNGIINISETLTEGKYGNMNKKQKEELKVILAVARRLSLLIKDIIDIEKIKRNEMKLNLTSIDIKSASVVVADVFKHLTEGKDVEILVNVPEKLSPVLADENRLLQILFNLVGNGVKFTSNGTVTLSAEDKGNFIKVIIEDTGIGISEEKQGKLFQAFTQAEDEISIQYGGSGLGLYISRQLVNRMNGQIFLEWSKPQKGTCFSFLLPKSKEEPVNRRDVFELRSEKISPITTVENKAVKSFKILAVDDEPTNLRVVKSIFNDEEHEVLTALSGIEAIEIIKRQKDIDIVLMDVMMPKMSGYEACRKIREWYSLYELPVLILTVRDTPEDIATSFNVGANDFVSKPFVAKELRTRVSNLLQIKKSIQRAVKNEMAFLQSQIKPHFLYNAMSTIMSFCYTDGARAGELMAYLSEYLQKSFNIDNTTTTVSLENELELTKAYTEIEKARFGERLIVKYDIDDSLKEQRILPLIIQPLVENSIRHGLMKRKDGGVVKITVKKEEKGIRVSVEDNGIGIEQIENVLENKTSSLKKSQGGVGISNIKGRLMRYYGVELYLYSKINEGTQVSFTLPDQDLN